MIHTNAFRPSMRTWLTALTLVAMLPVLLFALYTLDTLGEHDEQSLLRDLRRRTQGLQLMLNGQIDAAVLTLDTLARSDAAMRGDDRALYAHARRVIDNNPTYRAVTLVDAEGRMAFHTSLPYGKATFTPFHQKLIAQALQTGKPNLSGAFHSPVSPGPVVAITVPITGADGRRERCLRIIILVDTLRETLLRARLPEGWIAGIVDHEGKVIARTHQPEKFEGRPAGEQFRAAMRQNDKGFFPGVTLEGVAVMNAMFPLHGGDWVVGLGVPVKTLYQPRRDLLREMGLLAVLWVVVSLVAAQLLASYLVRQTQVVANGLTAEERRQHRKITIRVKEIWQMFHRTRNAEREVREAQQNLQSVMTQRNQVQDLYDEAPCGYHSLDRAGRVVQINHTELAWLDLRREDVIGRQYTDFLTADGRAAFRQKFPMFLETGHLRDLEIELLRRDGTTMPVLVSATAIRNAQGELLVSRSTVFDITERKALEKELERLAKTDMLTGLANRRKFEEHCESEIARSRRFNTPLSLMMLDIDHFKRVNDRYGHAAGDLVLKQLGQVCRAVLREIDLSARVGGEEFAVLMPETTLERAAEVAERLRLALAAESVLAPDSQSSISFTVSIGVGQLGAGDTTLDALLRRVDAALYQAKQGGRNRVVCAGDAAPVSA